MKWGYGKLYICGLLAVAGLPAFGQQYPFLPVAGAPKTPNQALFQDSRGRLWVGGQQLACFDGARFFFLTDYGFPQVPANQISEDPSGNIWVAAETGVYRLANGRVEEVAKGVAVSIIALKPDFAVASIGPLVYNNDLNFIPFLGTTPAPYSVSGSTAINDGNFHYVVGTYDGNNIDVYVDGALSTTLAQSGTLSSASTLTLLFGQSNTNEYYFNGVLDELRFSAIARNASWIAAEYANQNNQNNSVFLTIGPQQ